jgi:hypothetical protein
MYFAGKTSMYMYMDYVGVPPYLCEKIDLRIEYFQ